MADGLKALSERRLLIVMGKGGTGKTTLAAALGLAMAKRGVDTVVIEVGERPELPRLLCDTPEKFEGEVGRSPQPVAPHLFTARIVPEVALAEYLELQLHVRPLVRLMLSNPGFRRLLDAAPGWRALITLGKLWHLQSQTDNGRPRWPLLVVDAPSTGYGLSLLSVPQVVLDTVRLGPLRRQTAAVQALLEDPRRTLVLPVTLPEELPVSETLELCAKVRELGLPLGPLFANAVETSLDLPDPEALAAALARHEPPPEDAAWLEPRLVRRCVEHRRRRSELQRSFLERLEQESGCRPVRLPCLPAGLEGPASLTELAEGLGTELAEWEPVA